MKTCHKLFLLIAFAFIGINAFSQNKDPKTLVDEGVALFDKGNYNDAIEKYKDALKIDSTDLRADFELAYTLQTLGKGLEGIPYLEKVLKSNDFKYETYELLGSIYDDNKQPGKAVEAYKAGIKDKPDFSRLHLNLAITYIGLKRYAEAESEAIEAIKLDPKHASNHKIYALATYYQNKKACAIMGFCNFLLLEPQSNRSAGIYKYVDTIFKQEAGKNIVLSKDNFSGNNVSPMSLADISVNLAASAKDGLVKVGAGNPVDLMIFQLKTVFNATGKAAEKVGDKRDFFWSFYADYFYKLSNSDNLPTFTRYISLSVYKDENLAWFKEHDKELKDLQRWIASTERNF